MSSIHKAQDTDPEFVDSETDDCHAIFSGVSIHKAQDADPEFVKSIANLIGVIPEAFEHNTETGDCHAIVSDVSGNQAAIPLGSVGTVFPAKGAASAPAEPESGKTRLRG